MEEKVEWELVLQGMENDPTEKKPNFIERQFNTNEIKIELAFHEASHFVFDCLVLKWFNGFLPIKHMVTCLEKLFEDGFNVVRGVSPDVPERDTYVRSSRDEPRGYLNFYNEDKNRLVAKLLILIAGHTSFQVFLKAKVDIFHKEYYLNVFENPNSNKVGDQIKAKSFFLGSALDSDISDFNKINKKLRIYFQLNKRSEKDDALIKLEKAAQVLMECQAVNDSIRFIKNQLLKNECQKIEGRQLFLLVREVQRLTNKVVFDEVLNNLRHELEVK